MPVCSFLDKMRNIAPMLEYILACALISAGRSLKRLLISSFFSFINLLSNN